MNHKEKLLEARRLIREVISEHDNYDRARFRPGDVRAARESGEESGRLRAAALLLTEAYAITVLGSTPTGQVPA